VIEPLDEEERKQLLAQLMRERFGRRTRRRRKALVRVQDPPKVIAERRRVLCGLDQPREAA
jgi:hypothetical protein